MYEIGNALARRECDIYGYGTESLVSNLKNLKNERMESVRLSIDIQD